MHLPAPGSTPPALSLWNQRPRRYRQNRMTIDEIGFLRVARRTFKISRRRRTISTLRADLYAVYRGYQPGYSRLKPGRFA